MSAPRIVVAFVLALALVLCAAVASAETSRLTLAVDPSTGLDPEAVRAAVAAELAIDVVPATDPQAANLRLRDQNGLRLTFESSPGGRSAERALNRPASDSVATEMIALLAGNLVRDEAGELVERLRRARAERVARDEAAKKAAAAAAPTPASTNAPAPEPPRPGACSLARRGVVGADFVPFVGSVSGPGASRSTSSVASPRAYTAESSVAW
jgi:hypothetical protein